MNRTALALLTLGLGAAGAALAAPVTITAAVGSWIDPASPNTNATIRSLYQQFDKANPDITLKVDALDYGALQTKLLTTAAAGSLPDMAYVDSVWVQQLASLGVVQPLDGLWPAADRADYNKAFIQGAQYKGKIYAVWDSTDTRVLWYNTDMFKAAGIKNPPRTWNELSADAKKLTKGNTYGLGIALGQHEYLVGDLMLPMFWGLNGTLEDANGRPNFDKGMSKQALVKVLDYLASLKNQGVIAPDALNMQGENALYPGMVSGRYGMVIGNANLLSANLVKLQPDAANHWKPALLPAPTGGHSSAMNGGFTWAIFTKDPAKQAAAWKFISYWNSPAVQLQRYKATGDVPVRISTAKDPFFKGGYWDVVNKAVSVGHTRPGDALYPTISQQLQFAAQDVLSGKKTAEQAVADAGKAVQAEYTRQQNRGK